nr:HGGxSTG domain-containing protein [Ruegeria sp. EL01]
MTCGARLSDGTRCMSAPVNGKARCRQHGGASTGAKTPEGRKRQSEGAKARWAEINEALAMARAMRQQNNEAIV